MYMTLFRSVNKKNGLFEKMFRKRIQLENVVQHVL